METENRPAMLEMDNAKVEQTYTMMRIKFFDLFTGYTLKIVTVGLFLLLVLGAISWTDWTADDRIPRLNINAIAFGVVLPNAFFYGNYDKYLTDALT